ncbi:GDSL-like lipase/acylhydrolase family protein [Rhodobacter aestuarii]|uniref:GDSL-like Lipase/Acylhydrolase family protein n=2 Tax=Rhodobacter aestuarii TaxID=453582 RepID=A0A1N7J571_9RHOB|nr:GDSL-like lipase/acylhydrolase family protein [Rhodobacter aestuarii]SIS44492.1 GDSL-like Lipase/Acylhydrolase family protein [Rhodobacter aestuarii]
MSQLRSVFPIVDLAHGWLRESRGIAFCVTTLPLVHDKERHKAKTGESMSKRALRLLVMLCALGTGVPAQADILVMGDSLLAVNGLQGKSVAKELRRLLPGEHVRDRSKMGASYLYPLPVTGAMGMSIPKQYRQGNWDWVVLNGGGNDVLWNCGCGPCTRFLDKLITRDGMAGAIADQVRALRASGARVVFVGYLRSNGFDSPVDKCGPTGDEMDRRIGRLAKADPGVEFVPLADLVPEGDTSFYAPDRIHPSPKGSAAIAARIAKVIAP